MRPCFYQLCLGVAAVSFPAQCHSVQQQVGRAQCCGRSQVWMGLLEVSSPGLFIQLSQQ